MKKIFFILCVACTLFSCTKKDPAAVAPTDPWVKQGYLYNQNGFAGMVMLRDTFVALYNEFSGPRFYMGSGKQSAGFYGEDAPVTVNNNAIVVFRACEDRIYVEAEGLWYSNDLARSWTQLTTDLPGFLSISDIVAADAGVYLCANKIYFSSNKGANWTDISMSGIVRANTLVGIDNTLIASVWTSASGNTQVLYTSIDNGANWTAVDPSSQMGQLPFYKFTVVDNVLYGMTFNDYSSDLYFSKDKGQNWTLCKGLNSIGNNSVSSVELYNGTLYAGTQLGVFKSVDNGKHWVYSGGGNDVWELITKGDALYAVTPNGIWKIRL
ncbi:WD40/YVTN/BNR-like repeat-containing protein [Cytophaga aurantiaca]|uniref:WD40/YVTN/BNR-like repeat-containing protein n=1 Tax=Cytophaga aurantiaca TaxID=29530 RepID=UPI000376725D|nr:sialidase family protein [Cytophaga aurantiaca]